MTRLMTIAIWIGLLVVAAANVDGRAGAVREPLLPDRQLADLGHRARTARRRCAVACRLWSEPAADPCQTGRAVREEFHAVAERAAGETVRRHFRAAALWFDLGAGRRNDFGLDDLAAASRVCHPFGLGQACPARGGIRELCGAGPDGRTVPAISVRWWRSSGGRIPGENCDRRSRRTFWLRLPRILPRTGRRCRMLSSCIVTTSI